jgi:predicted anti-sigma-YlaC factor YlaD
VGLSQVNCRELVESLREYLDGEAPWLKRLLIRLHLLLCSACRAYLASYQTTRRLAHGLGQADAATELPDDLRVSLRESCPPPPAQGSPEPRSGK